MKNLTFYRELVSESRLHEFFDMKYSTNFFNEREVDKIELSNEDMLEIVEHFKLSIDKKAENLVKKTQNTLTNLPNNCIYKRIDDKVWLTSARICEIFRSPEVSKNSGRLNIETLQNIGKEE